jgi:hypothetical protein
MINQKYLFISKEIRKILNFRYFDLKKEYDVHLLHKEIFKYIFIHSNLRNRLTLQAVLWYEMNMIFNIHQL